MISKKKAWLLATRPKTLPASIGPVILGASLVDPDLVTKNLPTLVLTLLCAVTLQIGTNLVNDYYDSVRGLDDDNRLGPDRALQKGWLTREELKKGIIFVFTLALTMGAFLMYSGGLPIIAIGVFSILMAFMYTGGPLPLSYFGLGEVLALICFGPIPVWGTAFLLDKRFTWDAAIIGLVPGLVSMSLMAINNLRDHVNDKAKGKRTLATMAGPTFARGLVIMGVFTSIVIPTHFGFSTGVIQFYLPIIVFFAFSKNWWKVISGPIDSSLNNVLANTGKFLFLNCIGTAIGFIFLWN